MRRLRRGELALGAALLLTVAVGALDALRWPGGPGPSVPPPVTLQALLEEGSQERHSLYALLRQEAPGARIVIDTSGDRPDVDLTDLRTLGRAGAIDARALPAGWLDGLGEGAQPDATGSLRSSGWMWSRAPGPIDTVVVGSSDGRTVLVDRRVVPELDLAVRDATTSAPVAPSTARAVIVETVLLLALVLLGGLVLPRRLAPGAARPALALIAGVAVQAVTGFLFLAGRSAMVGGVVIATAVAWRLRSRGAAPGWRRDDVTGLIATGVMIAGTVAVVRVRGLVIVTADAVDLIARSIGMADGTVGLADLDEKRPLAGSAVHAPAHALGIEGLHALGWVLLIAIAVIVVLLPRLLAPSGSEPSRAVVVVSAATGATLLLSPLLRTIGALVSTHLMVGASLLLLAVLWALDDDRTSRSIAGPVVALTLLALVPTRAEAVLLVGLVLLATLAVTPDGASRSGAGSWAWPRAWPVLGAGLAVWNGLHVLAALGTEGRPSFPVTLLTALGVVVLLAPVGLRLLPERVRTALPRLAIGSLWGAVVALGVLSDRAAIFRGLRINIGEGAGAWGAFGPILAAAAVVAMVGAVLLRDRRLTVALWVTLGAFPSAVIAKAADGTQGVALDDPSAALRSILGAGARIGSWGDSTNRMWVHFAPAALALLVMVIAVATAGPQQVPTGRSTAARSALAVRDVPVLIVGGAALLMVLSIWRPTYLGPVAPGSTLVLEQRQPDVAGPELTSTTRYEHPFTVAAPGLPADADDLQVCVEYAFTDLGRTNWGLTVFGLTGPDGGATDGFGEFAWSGERRATVCLPVDDLTSPIEVVAWLTGGRGALPGSAPAALVDAVGDPVGRLSVVYVASSEDRRSLPMQLLSRSVRMLMRFGPALVALLLTVGLALILSGRPQGRPAG